LDSRPLLCHERAPMTEQKQKRAPKKKRRVVAVTGVHTFLGGRLIAELAADPRYEKIVALDLSPPSAPTADVVFHRVDLTEPGTDALLTDIFTSEKVDTVLHAAFLGDPTHDDDYAHELENIGTMYLLTAVQAAKVKKLVLCSSTMCYGADPLNPNYLSEAHPLQKGVSSRFIEDKVAAEDQVRRFAAENPRCVVTVLRPCTVVGPTIRSYATRFLSRRMVTTILGFDPLVQFLHEDDFVAAFKLALDKSCPGAFNLAGEGVMKLSSVFRLTGALVVPVPYFAAFAMMRVLWAAQLVEAPPRMLDYLRYLWVADATQAKTTLAFAPHYSSKDAIADFAAMLRVRRIPDVQPEL
jgi:UDP-glucose 4-epimerase